MIIAHDSVDRNALRAAPLTLSAGMTAVVAAQPGFVIRQHDLFFLLEPRPGQCFKGIQFLEAVHGRVDGVDIRVAETELDGSITGLISTCYADRT